MQAALAIPFCAVKFDCGCDAAGFSFAVNWSRTVLVLMSGWLLMGRGGTLCRYR
jgi:hypothetical protein